jgi:hypothetical protein
VSNFLGSIWSLSRTGWDWVSEPGFDPWASEVWNSVTGSGPPSYVWDLEKLPALSHDLGWKSGPVVLQSASGGWDCDVTRCRRPFIHQLYEKHLVITVLWVNIFEQLFETPHKGLGAPLYTTTKCNQNTTVVRKDAHKWQEKPCGISRTPDFWPHLRNI